MSKGISRESMVLIFLISTGVLFLIQYSQSNRNTNSQLLTPLIATTTTPPPLSLSTESAGYEWFSQPDNGHQGVLIAWAYCETSEISRTNAEYFFTVGISPYLNHPTVNFLLILMSNITIDIPRGNNVFVHYRHNFGMDVCAWNETMREPFISALTGRNLYEYRYFIWMNASVRGPFMPLGSTWTAWLPYFLRQINERDKLIGTSINCRAKSHVDPTLPHLPWGQLHVQSMFLAFDYHLLPYLLLHTPCGQHWRVAVLGGEIEFSRETLRRGYNVVSQMLPYRGVNWLSASDTTEACGYDLEQNGPKHEGDRQIADEYYGFSTHPLEMVFHKVNRKLYIPVVDKFTEWGIRAAYKLFPYRPNHKPINKVDMIKE